MKKRSGASYRSKRDSPLHLFIDRCLGKHRLSDALRKIEGLTVHIHDDHFAPDARDEAWLPKVAGREWVILTKDKAIRHHKIELEAVLANKAIMITFGGGDWTADEMAEALKKAWPQLRRTIARFHPPLIAQINKQGDLIVL